MMRITALEAVIRVFLRDEEADYVWNSKLLLIQHLSVFLLAMNWEHTLAHFAVPRILNIPNQEA